MRLPRQLKLARNDRNNISWVKIAGLAVERKVQDEISRLSLVVSSYFKTIEFSNKWQVISDEPKNEKP